MFITVSIIALVTAFASMFALGAGFQLRWFTQEMPKPSLIARCLGVALVAVPAMAIIVGSLLELKTGLLAGSLLIGTIGPALGCHAANFRTWQSHGVMVAGGSNPRYGRKASFPSRQ